MIVLVTVALAALVLGACGGSQKAPTTRYVALGDSAVAGAGIDRSPPAVCRRSDHNYPSLLAKTYDVDEFVDRSCPGATTGDVLNGLTRPDGAQAPPQIDAVTSNTDVVTISIGGNDGRFIPTLFLSCYMPPKNSSKTCRQALERLPALLPTITTDIVTTLEAIRERAPRALVVLVGYLRLMPDSGACGTVPIAPDDLRVAAMTEGELAAAMRAGAERAGATYVDMRRRSVGHDACQDSDHAWVSALTPAVGDGSLLHPRAVGMRAVARAVAPVVRSRLGR